MKTDNQPKIGKVYFDCGRATEKPKNCINWMIYDGSRFSHNDRLSGRARKLVTQISVHQTKNNNK